MIRLPLMGLVFACAVSMTSCGTKSRQASGNSDTAAVAVSVADTATAVIPVYAKGYAVKHLPGNVRLVDIHDPQKEEGNTFRYALVPILRHTLSRFLHIKKTECPLFNSYPSAPVKPNSSP